MKQNVYYLIKDKRGRNHFFKVYKADTAPIKGKLLWLKHILNSVFQQHCLLIRPCNVIIQPANHT